MVFKYNFCFQVSHDVFAVIKIVQIVLRKVHCRMINTRLTALKDFLFCILLLPNTLFIFSLFWIVFYLDRELAYPEVLDKYIPTWWNHVVHTLICLPLIVELSQEGKVITFPNYKTAFVILNTFGAAYQIGLVFTVRFDKLFF